MNDDQQQKIIVASLAPYFVKRFKQFGINMEDTRECKSCLEKMPNALFSISNDGVLNIYCKFCWNVANQKEKKDKSLNSCKFKNGLKSYFYKKNKQNETI